jgi:hypothetical protein
VANSGNGSPSVWLMSYIENRSFFNAFFHCGWLSGRDRARFDATGESLISRRTGFGQADKRCAVSEDISPGVQVSA